MSPVTDKYGQLQWYKLMNAFLLVMCLQVRATGLTIAHTLSMTVYGGLTPLLAVGFIRGTGDLASPAYVMIIAGVLSAAGLWMTRRFKGIY